MSETFETSTLYDELTEHFEVMIIGSPFKKIRISPTSSFRFLAILTEFDFELARHTLISWFLFKRLEAGERIWLALATHRPDALFFQFTKMGITGRWM